MWGALHHGYVAGDDADGEFRAMVDAFHDAGIEVILDVVYNHTTEEDELGPTFTLRGDRRRRVLRRYTTTARTATTPAAAT